MQNIGLSAFVDFTETFNIHITCIFLQRAQKSSFIERLSGLGVV